MSKLDIDPLTAAALVSRRLERKYGRIVEPGELLGPAWEGAARYPAFPVLAARNACLSYLRGRDGRRGRGRAELGRLTLLPSQSAGVAQAMRGIVSRDDAGDSPTLLGLWCQGVEARAAAGWSWRDRVMVYLYAVEGLCLAEAGGTFGLTTSRSSQVFAARLPAGLVAAVGQHRRKSPCPAHTTCSTEAGATTPSPHSEAKSHEPSECRHARPPQEDRVHGGVTGGLELHLRHVPVDDRPLPGGQS